MGKFVASILPQTLKVAVVYRAELINKFFENVAVNRGANLVVLSDRASALRGLGVRDPCRAAPSVPGATHVRSNLTDKIFY